MDNFGLSENSIRAIKDLFTRFPQIRLVKIFGSRAKGNFKPNSDIDLVFFGETEDKLLRHIAFELDELPTPYKFDLLNYNDISNQKLKQSIDTYGKIFFKSDLQNL